MNGYTIIYYYDKKCNLIKLKDCIIEKEFIFDRQNLILLSRNNRYYVCKEHSKKDNGNILMSFWGHNKKDLSSSEVISLFRKEYKKHEINVDKIDKFLDNPHYEKRKN